MPILKNPRHEKFCQFYSQGMSQEDAYEKAGYKRNRKSANNLWTKMDIKQRVSEIKEELQEEIKVEFKMSKEEVLNELLTNANLARQAEQYSAANKAMELIGKEIGLFVEKKKVQHSGEISFGKILEELDGKSIGL